MDNENMSAVETTNHDAQGDAFLSAFGWDEKNPDTDAEQTAKAEDKPAEDAKPEEAQKDDGKDYPIRYKGKDEVLHLTDDQLTAMLQKGRDYDEVRKQRDDLSAKAADYDSLNRMADYFASNNGMGRKEYMEYIDSQTTEAGIRTRIAEEHPDLDEDVVGKLVELEVSKLTAAKEAAADEETANDIAALRAEYPDANINDLPSDVQADIENGMKPVEAMRMHELRELRKSKAELDTEIAALKKEKDNHFRSTGRAESKSSDAAADPFITAFMGGG